jgi:hypothetical protein
MGARIRGGTEGFVNQNGRMVPFDLAGVGFNV